MSLSESGSVLSSTSTLSLNAPHIDCPHPIPGDCTMSLPQLRKRLRSLRPANMKRRKVSQETVSGSSSARPQQDATVPAAAQPASSSAKGQATVNIVPQNSFPHEPSRKRNVVPQWLEKQAQRLEGLRRGSLWHRDSMFDSQDVEQEPKQAAEDADATVSESHSESVPQRVIDHFFTLYPAGGSDWRNSARWERHLAKCAVTECAICEATKEPPKKSRPSARSPAKLPTRLPASPSASPPARSPTESPSEFPKGSYFSIPLWRSKSDKRRRRRGKSPAPDETDENSSGVDDAEPISPRTQAPRYLETPFSRISRKPGIVIYDSTARFERRVPPPPVRCTSVSKPVDASKIPVPAVPDLKPPSTEAIDIRDLSHITGRPYEICPLELLHFPLSRCYNPPSTPQLRPERVISPIPEMEQLTDASRVSSDDSLLSHISPVPSVGPSATNVQRWPAQPPSTLHNTSVPTTIADMLSQDSGREMPTIRKRRAAVGTTTHRTPAPAPAMQFPPTPPDSRHTSNAWQPGFSYTAYDSEASPSEEPVATPEGPADRDWATCVLSDTTGSSLPNCPTYVNPREKLDKYWAGFAERHGPGMRIWR